MKVVSRYGVSAAAVICASGSAVAQTASVTVDGVADAAYGDAAAVQNTNTQFGDASDGALGFCNGSEIDGLYALVEDGYLHLLIAGNLESNFNKLEIFIDAVPGEGQNPILGNNNEIDFGALNTMGEYTDPKTGEVQPGLTFDAAFVPDFWITLTGGQGSGPKGEPIYDTYCSYAKLLTGGGDSGPAGFAGPGHAGAKGALGLDNGIEIAIDNSNVGGVIGGAELNEDGGLGVSTGIEVAIPLAALDHSEGDTILVSAMINGSGHDFLSNQVIGGLGGGENLGFPRFVNFEVIPGEQFVIVPDDGGGGTACPGDFNADGEVNGADFGEILASWGDCGGCSQDLDGDGVVGGSDVGAFLAAWGACPEPPNPLGNCDEPHAEPGCTDSECETVVCEIDSFCCTVTWDNACVEKALANCGG